MLQTNTNLWCYIDSDDYASECFASKEDALKDWLANRKDEDVNVVAIGHPSFYVPIVDAEIVINNIQSQAEYDTYGYSEENREYLWRVKDKHLEELEDALTNVFFKWSEKHGYNEEMYVVEKPDRYMLMSNGELCCIRKKKK